MKQKIVTKKFKNCFLVNKNYLKNSRFPCEFFEIVDLNFINQL